MIVAIIIALCARQEPVLTNTYRRVGGGGGVVNYGEQQRNIIFFSINPTVLLTASDKKSELVMITVEK
jgi:hypothetical protein